MNQFGQGARGEVDYDEIMESLEDERRDTLKSVVDGELKLSEVSTRYLLDDVWMNDLFVAMCAKKYGRHMTLNQFYRLRAVSYLEKLPGRSDLV